MPATPLRFIRQDVQSMHAYAANVCENAPLTLAAAKRALMELRKNPADRDLDRVKAMVDACFMSEDYKEGRKAFAEKRPPQFKAQ